MDNADKPAFPTSRSSFPQVKDGGLTKRERFAMAAMQGLMASEVVMKDGFGQPQIAEWAVSQADALLTELNQ